MVFEMLSLFFTTATCTPTSGTEHKKTGKLNPSSPFRRFKRPVGVTNFLSPVLVYTFGAAININ
jgi:hypothetical protein